MIGWARAHELRSSIYIENGECLLTDSRDTAGASAAVEQFQTACDITPEDPAPWYELANALAVSGAHPEALRAYGEVERLSPDYGRLHFNRGTSLFNLRKIYAAEHEMSLAYKQDGLPDSRQRLSYLRNLIQSRKNGMYGNTEER
jgi:tetratricopeptide (TPR) repeat protein